MNLKVPGAILPLGCAILSTRAKTVRGVGTPPFRRTRVKQLKTSVHFARFMLCCTFLCLYTLIGTLLANRSVQW